MNNKKIVYITGCLGFMGAYITRAALKSGWYVRGIDKITYAANIDLLDEFKKYPNFVFEQKDINDINFLYECDYIINTAAETHVDNSIADSSTFIHSNINGVHHLLEFIRLNRTGKMPILLHFSTDEVYGDISNGRHTERDLLKPSNPYSATKAAGDMLILAWARTYGVPYIIVRPTNNYGIGQYIEKLIPKSCKFLHLERKIPLHEKGLPVRTWLHAQDTADAIMTIINANSDAINKIFNISSQFEQSNIETVNQILRAYFNNNIPGPIENYVDFSVTRPGQDVRYSIDDTNLRNLGWQPKIILSEELPNIVKYYKEKFIW
jgi:dTDP-glucose 4,6-dehydratase